MLETSARLLRLLSLLQARRDWTSAELAARLDVTTRTIRNDVARLRALGYPVEARPGVAGATGSAREAPCRRCCSTTRRRWRSRSDCGPRKRLGRRVEEASVRALAKLQSASLAAAPPGQRVCIVHTAHAVPAGRRWIRTC